jgi:cytochrome c-type biogenesis protein CcmH/NrfG
LTEGGWELAYLDAKLDANRKEYDIAVTRERGTELEEERLQLYLKGASLVGERLAKRRKIQ